MFELLVDCKLSGGLKILCTLNWAKCRFLVDVVKVAIDLEANAYTKEELEGDEVRPVCFVSKQEIEKKVRILMYDAEGHFVRQNTKNLRVKAREANAPGGPSRRNFETYVRHLRDNAH